MILAKRKTQNRDVISKQITPQNKHKQFGFYIIVKSPNT